MTRSSPARTPALALLAAVLAGAGCGAPRDPVSALLARLERGAEARDADAVVAELAADFEGRDGMSRERATETLRRLLLGYEEASIEIYGVSQEPTEMGARVSLFVEFSGRARRLGGLDALLPPGAVYRFELELRRGDPEWRVVAASWEPSRAPGDAATGVSSNGEEGTR